MTRQVPRGISSGELTLVPVSLQTLDDIFFSMAPVLSLALGKTEEIDMRQLFLLLQQERLTLLVETLDGTPQGCCVTTVVHYPLYAALEIVAIAGLPDKSMMYPNVHSFENLKAWARFLGCARIQGFTNEAVGRLWKRIGFTEASRKMEIKL